MWSNAFKPAAKDRSTLVLAVAPAEAAKASIFLIALRLDRHLLLAVPLKASILGLAGAEGDRVQVVGALVQSWRAPLIARHGRQHQAGIDQTGSFARL